MTEVQPFDYAATLSAAKIAIQSALTRAVRAMSTLN
jgi:hypothetical protein